MNHPKSNLPALLNLLKAKRGRFYSGARLASELGLTRAAVWKHIHSLKERGYQIISHPKQGYQLMEVPDILSAEEILPALRTRWLGRSYHHLAQTGSTNDEALRLAARGAPHGSVIIAEEQLAGRGRLARPWFSAPGLGIYLSMILRDALPSRDAPKATLVAALSLVTVLRQSFDLPALIKWPNDVLIRGKKISGILTEMQSDQDVVRFLVMGIGINANHGREEMAGPFRVPATSVAIECGHSVHRRDLLGAFLERFEPDYERFRRDGFSELLPELENVSAVLGQTITLHCGNETLTGNAVGLTADGALRLILENGQERVIWVGDVTQIQGGLTG